MIIIRCNVKVCFFHKLMLNSIKNLKTNTKRKELLYTYLIPFLGNFYFY